MKYYSALLAVILLFPISWAMAQESEAELETPPESQALPDADASAELPQEPNSQAQAPTQRPAQIKEATITLQTTVTGNQEQPRVLYILPWQSPLMGDVEFQTLISQQEEVFGHLEREELRRTLEAVEAMDKAKQ